MNVKFSIQLALTAIVSSGITYAVMQHPNEVGDNSHVESEYNDRSEVKKMVASVSRGHAVSERHSESIELESYSEETSEPRDRVPSNSDVEKIDLSYSRERPIRLEHVEQVLAQAFGKSVNGSVGNNEVEKSRQLHRDFMKALMSGEEKLDSVYAYDSNLVQSKSGNNDAVKAYVDNLDVPHNLSEIADSYHSNLSHDQQNYLLDQLPSWVVDAEETIAFAEGLNTAQREELHSRIDEMVDSWNLSR